MNGRTLSAPPPLPRRDLPVYLADQIRELIESQGLQAGDRLPSAKALAAHFTVAVPTLREAIRRLQVSGVLDIRHGSGTYVRSRHERLVLANSHSGTLEDRVLLHLAEARLLIEPHLAELAAPRIDDAELDELERLLHEAEPYLLSDTRQERRSGNLAFFHKVNLAFHSTIARASGNTVLAEIVESLTEVHSFERLGLSPPGNRAKGREGHLRILRALRERDAQRAREEMRVHIQEVISILEAKLASTDQDQQNNDSDPSI